MGKLRFGRFPIDPAGVSYSLFFLALFMIGFAFSWWLLWIPALLGLAVILFFFRDFPREIPTQPGAIVSPADGTVDQIVINQDPEAGPVGGPRISIFLSVLSVHVNRAPCAGRIESTRHVPGEFMNAMQTECADKNECNWIFMRSGRHRITIRQISGLIARCIVCRVEPGQTVRRGERIGIIKFGSRTELYLPPEATVACEVGQKVHGGSSILAWLPE